MPVLFENICLMPLTFSCFVSPSGAGLKIIVRVSSNADQHKTAFKQLRELYERELNVVIDKSGSDVSRLCYYSCDKNIYLNEDARIFTLTYELPAQINIPQQNHFNPAHLGADVFEKSLQLTENIYQFSEGKRNKFFYFQITIFCSFS